MTTALWRVNISLQWTPRSFELPLPFSFFLRATFHMHISRVLRVQHLTNPDWLTLIFVKQYKLWSCLWFCNCLWWYTSITLDMALCGRRFGFSPGSTFGNFILTALWVFLVLLLRPRWRSRSLVPATRASPHNKFISRKRVQETHCVIYVRNITIEWLRFLLSQPCVFLLSCRRWE